VKITKIVATDDKGVEHHFEGIEGALHVRSMNAKTVKQEPYQRRVECSLLLPPDPEVKA
jgi:hypothetical protein